MSKFLVLILAVVSLWYVMRWVQQFEGARRMRQSRPATSLRATDTVACGRCGTYVPADDMTACSRRDCPFPRRG